MGNLRFQSEIAKQEISISRGGAIFGGFLVQPSDTVFIMHFTAIETSFAPESRDFRAGVLESGLSVYVRYAVFPFLHPCCCVFVLCRDYHQGAQATGERCFFE